MDILHNIRSMLLACTLLGAAVLDTSLACTLDEIQGCTKTIEALTQLENPDLNLICSEISNASECLQNKLEECPNTLKPVVQQLLPYMEQLQGNFCQAPGGNSLCTVDDIMDCVAPISNMTTSEHFDVAKSCHLLQTALDCLTDEMDTCPEALQGMLKVQRENLYLSLAPCNSTLNNTGSGTGGSSMCTANDILECVDPLSLMTESERTDLTIACPKIMNAVKCLNDEIETCPDSLKKQFEAQRDQLATATSLCEGVDGNSKCNSVHIMKCLQPMNVSASDQMDMKKSCLAIQEAVECLTATIDTCPDALKSQFKMQKDQLQMSLSMCGSYLNNTDSGGDNKCTISHFQKCQSPMLEGQRLQDLSQSCRKLQEGIECMKNVVETCPDDANSQYQLAMDEVTASFAFCEYHFSNPTPDPLGCSTQAIWDCSLPLRSLPVMELNTVFCSKLNVSITCEIGVVDLCPETLKSMMEKNIKTMGKTLEHCGIQINKTTDQNATHGNDKACANKVMECLKLVQNLPLAQQRSMDDLCSKSKMASDCLQKEVECSNVMMRERASLKETMAFCEYHINNPDDSRCSIERFMNCTDPSTTMSEEEMEKIEIYCRNMLPIVSCQVKEVSACPESLKSELKVFQSGVNKTRSYCGITTNETTDPGQAGPSSGGCSKYELMACLAPTQRISASDRRNLNVMCPTTLAAIACVTKKMTPCPEAVQAQFQMPMGQLQMGRSLCEQYWSAASPGLQWNILLTMIAASVVVFRHLL